MGVNLSSSDTIVAIASPPGRAGVGVIRLSGPKACELALSLTGREALQPRTALYGEWHSAEGRLLDSGITLFFPGPNSFTGENVVELQGHASPVVQDGLMHALMAMGARMAEPGEFSRRAFLNDKLDLAQAEAIADLINAHSEAAVQSAFRSLSGVFSDQVHALVDALIQLRVFVEATLDFPEEEIDFLTESDSLSRLQGIREQLTQILARAHQGRLLQEGIKVVLVGAPNAGKSSLLNYLAGTDAAIVTDIPGTTRDLLQVDIQLAGLKMHLTDTAGLRDSDDLVEQEGIRRAKRALADADVALHLVDIRDPEIADEALTQVSAPVISVRTKCDLAPERVLADAVYGISVKTGGGIAELQGAICEAVGMQSQSENLFIARRRHLQALEEAQTHLQQAEEQLLAQAAELLAEELSLAQNALSRITGRFSSDDLLGEIFSSFCIGK